MVKNELEQKQHDTVYGYIRQNHHYHNIPMDIIDIIYKFYLIKIDSKILTYNETFKLFQFMNNKLNENKNNKNNIDIQFEFELLYRWSENIQTISEFHKLCDDKGATLIIVKSKPFNHVFGGYTSLSWQTYHLHWRVDDDAFIFLLRSSFGHKSQIFNFTDIGHKKAVYHSSRIGPWIGYCGAIGIKTNDGKGTSYIATDCIDGIYGNGLCGGHQYITISNKKYQFDIGDYEVFAVKKQNI